MKRKHNRIRTRWFRLTIIAMAVALIAALLYFMPRVQIEVRTELTGPPDRAMDLLFQRAPLQDITSAVRQSGKHVDQICFLGGSLLLYAVEEGRPDLARWLIDEGANVNGVHRSMVPLETAIRQEDTAMVKLLLAAGADPDFDMGFGLTPREKAEWLGDVDILLLLPPKREPQRTAN